MVKDLRAILDDALNDNESLKEFIVEVGSALALVIPKSRLKLI